MRATEQLATQLYNQLVGWRSGIVKEVYESPHLEGEPKIYNYACRTCDLSRLGREGTSMTCGGAGFFPDEAMLACLGEAVERYCCQFYKEEDLLLSTYDDICEQAINPLSIAIFSNEQYLSPSFPFSPLTCKTPVWWVEAHSLTKQHYRYVPACIVYMPYRIRDPEPPITPAISTGLSCDCSFEQAAMKGLCEVVERDAFTITWLKRVPTTELIDIPADIKETFNYGLIEYHAYDLTSDSGIPVYLVLSRGNSDFGELTTVGVAASLEPVEALRKAFLENAQGRLCLRALKRERPDWTISENFMNVLTFDDHAMVLTTKPELLDRLDFLGAKGKRTFNANPEQRFSDVRMTLSMCVQRLASIGLEVFVKDLTTEDVKSLGLHVVRIIVPGMQPLHGTHLLPFIGGKRLERTGEIFNVSDNDILPAGRFNPIPHPLP
ncbi:MAG: YcaO-like family protein [Desulfobacteraceae bacterium]|nr:YcaO-like family protein [Desulfobacteraceae bacterium]